MSEPGLTLIETFRFEPGAGFLNLDLHRARMTRSADALGLPFSGPAFDHALGGVPQDQGPRRVRLELMEDGRIALTEAGFTPLPEGTVWKVALAEHTRLDPADPLLAHKTSRRGQYNAARAEFATDRIDEVLLLNQRGEVSEGTITSLFVPDKRGRLKTPPLASGLLAGVLREKLISDGRAYEAVIVPDDLRGQSFYMGNSLRGLIPARLA